MKMLKKNSVQTIIIAATAFLLVGCGDHGSRSFGAGNFQENYAFNPSSDTAVGQFHGGMLGAMGNLIDLSADQKAKIDSIIKKYLPSHERGKEGIAGRKALRDSVKNAIYAVLTDNQKAFLDTIKAQFKAGIVPDTIVKKRVARLTTLLTLTEDQQTQAFTILKQAMQERLQARIKDSASVDSSAAYEKKRHGKGFRGMEPSGLPSAFINILTDDQKKILEQKRAAFGHRRGR